MPKRAAGLIADGEATTRVVEILKKYRARSATLSSAQRTSLVAELKGAGQWSAAAMPAPANRRQAAPRAATTLSPGNASRPRRRAMSAEKEPAARTSSASRGRSGSPRRTGRGRGGSRHQTETPRTPDGGYIAAAGNKQRRKSKGRRLEKAPATATPATKKVTLVGTEPSAGTTEAQPDATAWQCADCGMLHDKSFKRQCRRCSWKRDPTSMAAGAVASSPVVDRAVVLAKKQQLMSVLMDLKNNNVPGIEGSIVALQAEIEALQEPLVPAPTPDIVVQLGNAQLAVEAALTRINYITKLIEGTDMRIDRFQSDREALGQSLNNGQQRHHEALSALAIVRSAVGAQTATAPAAATPTSHGTGVMATPPNKANVVIARHLAALSSPDSNVLLQIRSQLEETGGADAASILTKVLVQFMSTVQQELAEDAPLTVEMPPEASAAPLLTAPSRAQAARIASATGMSGTEEDSRLRARDQVKDGSRLPAQAMASPTQVAKVAHAELARVVKRDTAITAARAGADAAARLSQLQVEEAEAAFVEEQAAAERLQEAMGMETPEDVP